MSEHDQEEGFGFASAESPLWDPRPLYSRAEGFSIPIIEAGAFTCPCCGAASSNPDDIGQGYCGRCHWWTGDPVLGPPHLNASCEARGES